MTNMSLFPLYIIQDRESIEMIRVSFQLFFSQIALGNPLELAQFIPGNVRLWQNITFQCTKTAFDLNKNDVASLFGDNIYFPKAFTTRIAVICRKNPIPFVLEIPATEFFAQRTKF